MFDWLKRLLRKKPDFREILWVQSGGEIVIRYQGDRYFVRGDWDDFKRYSDRDDLVFYHTHPQGSPSLSETDKRNMVSIRMALKHDYVFVLITEDSEGKRIDKMFMVVYDPYRKEVKINNGVSLEDFADVRESFIRKAWEESKSA